MSENSAIEWCTHTFNPWVGCAKVSPGCKHCYAETLMDKRYGRVEWGVHGTRSKTSPGNWKKPLRWDRLAAESGTRARVFCASLADVFEDRPELVEWRAELFALIEATPNLDWQLLTKRPELIMRMVPDSWALDGFPPNVWIGTSVEDQERADERIPELLALPAQVRFLSCEPLLGPVDLSPWFATLDHEAAGLALDPLSASLLQRGMDDGLASAPTLGERIHWVIVGGESGNGARPIDVEWIRGIVRECSAAGVATFVKQLGANVRDRNDVGFAADEEWFTETGESTNPTGWPSTVEVVHNPNGFLEEYQSAPVRVVLADRKGGDPEQWPEDLRVREFPANDLNPDI